MILSLYCLYGTLVVHKKLITLKIIRREQKSSTV